MMWFAHDRLPCFEQDGSGIGGGGDTSAGDFGNGGADPNTVSAADNPGTGFVDNGNFDLGNNPDAVIGQDSPSFTTADATTLGAVGLGAAATAMSGSPTATGLAIGAGVLGMGPSSVAQALSDLAHDVNLGMGMSLENGQVGMYGADSPGFSVASGGDPNNGSDPGWLYDNSSVGGQGG